MASFTGVGDNVELFVPDRGEQISIAISGTYAMTILFQKELGSKGSGSWETVNTYSTANATVAAVYTTKSFGENLRLIVTVDTSGTATATLADNFNKDILVFKDQVGNTKFTVSQDAFDFSVAPNPPAPVSIAAATTLTAAAHAGRIVVCTGTTGFAVTLPAPAGTGNVYTVFYADTVSSGSHTIVAAGASQDFQGGVSIATDIAGVSVLSNVGDDTITMNGSTTGGVAGTWLRFTDVDSTSFMLEGFLASTGAEADPFSAAV